ncbi:MAG: 8-oxoguanine DNA glycosylase [Candidatus Bathyarchaeota archaeon]|nr:8-oxoguanine DNA glycosylase [Candidatus Bathyarchaeota archaeon]
MKLGDTPFNLDATLCCGQVFRWEKVRGWWYGVTGDRAFKIRQIGDMLEFTNASEQFIKRYFGLGDDLPKISAEIGKDDYIRAALREFWGMRIIRQDPWECLISYICATYKSIPAIKRMLLNLSRKFGEKTTLDGMEFFTFPTPETLASARVQQLAECGLGYRARFVLETSKQIFEGRFMLESLRQLPYEQAKKQLCTLPGVGPKVADCVLLFSLDKLEAFPVDRWIARVIVNHYGHMLPRELAKKLLGKECLSSAEYMRLNAFGREYFGQYAGYAQEYLYHYERMNAAGCKIGV